MCDLDRKIIDDYQTGDADFFALEWDSLSDSHLRELQDRALAAITECANACDDARMLDRIRWHRTEIETHPDNLVRHRLIVHIVAG